MARGLAVTHGRAWELRLTRVIMACTSGTRLVPPTRKTLSIDLTVRFAPSMASCLGQKIMTTVKKKRLLADPGTPGMVPGMCKRGIIPHWGCFLTVVVR